MLKGQHYKYIHTHGVQWRLACHFTIPPILRFFFEFSLGKILTKHFLSLRELLRKKFEPPIWGGRRTFKKSKSVFNRQDSREIEGKERYLILICYILNESDLIRCYWVNYARITFVVFLFCFFSLHLFGKKGRHNQHELQPTLFQVYLLLIVYWR